MADDITFSLIKVILITVCTLGMMSSLTVFKYSVKKVLTILGIYMLWVGISSWSTLAVLPYNSSIRLFLLTISAPAILLAYHMDKDSPAQSVFNYTTQISFSLLLGVSAFILNTAMEGNQYTDLAIRAVQYSFAIFLEYHFLRKPFRLLAEVITSGWGILSLIPVCFCILIVMLATVPVHFSSNPVNVIFIFAIAVTMLIIYMVIYQSLMRQYRLQLLTRDKDLLQVQISAMDKQADAIGAAEEKLKILRHDTRHFMRVMGTCLQHNSVEQATEVLSSFTAVFEHIKTKSYCDNHLINSILVSYFEQAEKEGIVINVNFSPPFKIDFTAFSVMLANVLENALEECKKEKGECSIELKSRTFHGQYLIELSNTCHNNIIFDKDNIPLSQKGKGHGIGTRSILAFAKQHNAAVSFEVVEDRFIFQMMLSLEDNP